MALLHFYIPCALIMAFQFAQKIRGVIGRKIEIDIFKHMEEIMIFLGSMLIRNHLIFWKYFLNISRLVWLLTPSVSQKSKRITVYCQSISILHHM